MLTRDLTRSRNLSQLVLASRSRTGFAAVFILRTTHPMLFPQMLKSCGKPLFSISFCVLSSDSGFCPHRSVFCVLALSPRARPDSDLPAPRLPLSNSGGLSPIEVNGARGKCSAPESVVHTACTVFPQASRSHNFSRTLSFEREISIIYKTRCRYWLLW